MRYKTVKKTKDGLAPVVLSKGKADLPYCDDHNRLSSGSLPSDSDGRTIPAASLLLSSLILSTCHR